MAVAAVRKSPLDEQDKIGVTDEVDDVLADRLLSAEREPVDVRTTPLEFPRRS